MAKEIISQLIEDTAAGLGYMIYDISLLLKGENSRINVKIDSLKGITLDDCEKFSRELAARLDAKDVLPNYSLEVSSPGIKRLVRNGDEFRRFSGASVKIIYRINEGSTFVKGRIGNVTENSVTVSTDTGDVAIRLDAITSANLDY